MRYAVAAVRRSRATTRRTHGERAAFTLIELMIVVAILGVLAAIGIPAFARYIERSRASEAYAQLKTMYTGVATYYTTPFQSQGLLGGTSEHCFPSNPTTPQPLPVITEQKALGDFESEASWKAINFAPADPLLFSYWFQTPAACDVENTAVNVDYFVGAARDHNADNVAEAYSLNFFVRDAEIVRAPGVDRVENVPVPFW